MRYKCHNQPNKGRQLWHSTELLSAATLLRSSSTSLQSLHSSLDLVLRVESYQATATVVNMISMAFVSLIATKNEDAKLIQEEISSTLYLIVVTMEFKFIELLLVNTYMM